MLSEQVIDQVSQVAQDAARRGAEIGKRFFESDAIRGDSAIRQKTSNDEVRSYDLVTDADVESERTIVEFIQSQFPDHQVLGEEFAEAELDARDLWIVDPLDGTNNFAHGIPHWAVSIGYYHLGQAVCGVVYNPMREDHFFAARGRGATHNDRPIQVSENRELTDALIGVGFYYDRGEKMEATLRAVGDLFRAHIHGIRRFGTAALDLCQTAMGWYGGFFEYELAPWDIGAGRLIVEEAGGKVTDCLGQPLGVGRSSVLASNGRLHDELLDIVKRHFPTPDGNG